MNPNVSGRRPSRLAETMSASLGSSPPLAKVNAQIMYAMFKRDTSSARHSQAEKDLVEDMAHWLGDILA
jgi:hypothetical protein